MPLDLLPVARRSAGLMLPGFLIYQEKPEIRMFVCSLPVFNVALA